MIEPQQPDKSLGQKINKVFDDNSRRADEHEECIPREYYKEVVSEILAAISQPAEGELAKCPSPSCRESAARKELSCGGCIGKQYAQAQLAHDKATMASPELVHELRVEIAELADKAQNIKDAIATMVRLPSDIDDFGLRLHPIIRRHISFSEVDDEIILDDYAIAQELLKLLREEKP